MNKPKGVVLLIALGTAVILSVLGAAFYVASLSDQQLAENRRNMSLAAQNAETGIERALFELREDIFHDPTNTRSWLAAPGIDLSNRRVQRFGPVANNEGSYSVELEELRTDLIEVRASGSVHGIVQNARVNIIMVNHCIWNNAVFGNRSTSRQLFNGNAEIHGSVYLMGINEHGRDFNANEAALTMGGNVLISNTYIGTRPFPEEFEGLIPTDIHTLNAEMRVRRGRVEYTGSVSVGQEGVDILDGTFVTHGFWERGVREINPSDDIFSVNGCLSPYDMEGETRIFLPRLTENGNDSPFSVDFKSRASSITGSVEIGPALRIPAPAPGDGTLTFNAATRTLTVRGLVFINGDLTINGHEPITYDGSGSILVAGRVNVETNFLPRHAFPSPDIVGIMAAGDINLGVRASQVSIAGLFYSERNIFLGKQTALAGTIVCDNFDMGGNVPRIYQVPSTMEHLPRGLIGSDPIWVMKTLSWRKE